MSVDVLRIAKKNKEREKQAWERAFSMTPSELHGFIHEIENKKKLFPFAVNMNKELESLGVSVYKNNTYQTLVNPYMAVDGRIKEMMMEHEGSEDKVEISPPEITEINGQYILSHTVKCKRGMATGTAKVGFGGNGADSTNPIENASTSALGRALGFLGYGVFGVGVASAEEIMAAFEEQSEQRNQVEHSHEKQNVTPINRTPGYFDLCKEKGLADSEARLLLERAFPNQSNFSPQQLTNLAERIKDCSVEELRAAINSKEESK